MRTFLIINPAAGNGRGGKVGHKTETHLRNNGVEYSVSHSEFPGHIVELAATVDCDHYDAVTAVGGDGTIFEVINGLFKSGNYKRIKLGVIPVGTGNSFAHDIYAHRAIDAAVHAIARDEYRAVDVGMLSTDRNIYYFLNLVGCGFVSDVCAAARRYKALRQLSYIIGVIQVAVTLSHYELELTIDGKKYARKNCFVEICNSRYTGGNMLMAPGAKIDDGLLDVVLLNDISRIGLLRAFPRVFKGEHVTLPQVEVFQGKRVTVHTDPPKILTPDGEILGHTPFEVEILPQKIEVFGQWNI